MYSIFIEEAPDGEEEAVISDQGIYFHLNTYHAGSIIINESLLKKIHLKFLAKKTGNYGNSLERRETSKKPTSLVCVHIFSSFTGL